MSTDPRYMLAMQMIQDEIAQGRLQLDRDVYQNIQLPTYQNVTFPTSYGQNTGYLPDTYPGPYAGMPTFGNVMGQAGLFGDAGYDPRLAALGYTPGTLTLGGQAQRLAEEQARARQSEFDRTFGLQRDQFTDQRFQNAQDQANKDRQYALEINADPNSIVAGQILPDWLKPHAEWARQFASQNGGRLPTIQALRDTLAPAGRSPEDYLPGGSQYGSNSNATVQTLGQGAPVQGAPNTTPFGTPAGTAPGAPTAPSTPTNLAQRLSTIFAAAKRANPNLAGGGPEAAGIWQQEIPGLSAEGAQQMAAWANAQWGAGTPPTDASIAAQLQAVQGSAQASPAAEDPNARQGLMSGQQGGEMQYGPNAMMASPTNPLYQQYGQSPDMVRAPGMNYQRQGGQQYGGNAMMYGGGQYGGYGAGLSPAVNYAGSGQTGQIGNGQAMSLDQRRLIEQGRATDINAGFTQNAQRLQALQQESQLRADPFALARYRYGLQGGGVLGAIGGQGVIPNSQGPQGPAPAMPSLYNQQREAQGMPTFGQADPMQQLQGLAPLNQINARNYYRAGAQGQNYANSAYRAAGLAGTDQDVQEAARRALPQFARRGVPTFGRAA